jgi:hypothetical protein
MATMIPCDLLPHCLWRDNVLHLSDDVHDVYEAMLKELALFDKALAYQGGKPVHGGESQDDTYEHFCTRYLNSVSRVQCVMLDPHKSFEDIPRDLLNPR